MKVLILSFYYPPDLSAGSFRMEGLIAALERARKTTPNLEVDVITTQPNRYAHTSQTVQFFESYGWLRIHRIPLSPHNSGMKDQARSFLSYARGVKRLVRSSDWDIVFATSSRLMTAALAAQIAKRMKRPLYLDIRDLFTDTMDDVLYGTFLHRLLPLFARIEKRTLGQADRINVVSEGFISHIKQLAPKSRCTVFTNGISDAFLTTKFDAPPEREIPRVLYAGNIGEGQGLHKILPQASLALRGQANFRVVGDGGRLQMLRDAISNHSETENLTLVPPVPRLKLIDEYSQANILLLHLNDYPAFRKVLPSKIFEYATTKRPIVAGVSGYAREFLERYVPHAHVFDPCDTEGLVSAIIAAQKGPKTVDRSKFFDNFSQASIMDKLAADIICTGS